MVLLVRAGLAGRVAVLLAEWVARLGSSLSVLLRTPPRRRSVLHPELEGATAPWAALFSRTVTSEQEGKPSLCPSCSVSVLLTKASAAQSHRVGTRSLPLPQKLEPKDGDPGKAGELDAAL